MPSLFETVFLIGATSGIGEELARQYHAKGKKVIISGRRADRLAQLKAELPGVEGIQMDIQALDSIPGVIAQAFEKFRTIDAVILVAGQQNYYNFNSAKPSPVAGKGIPVTGDISSEVTTNFTGPVVLAREVIKHALSGSGAAKPFTLAFVTSGLAYVPVPIFPIYCASKAGLHYFIISLRAQLSGTNIHTVEIVPPYVKTELDTHHRDVIEAAMGDKAPPGEDAVNYVQNLIQSLDNLSDNGEPPQVVAEGLPLQMANTWSNAFRPLAKAFGLKL